ncbi:MAG: hypothetical protein KH897_12805 [Bacteroides sp.]|nr:hypothetical protein [Bacteroides sp.]MBS6239206.1 hypothetical protein [Bacteroides sp.]
MKTKNIENMVNHITALQEKLCHLGAPYENNLGIFHFVALLFNQVSP